MHSGTREAETETGTQQGGFGWLLLSYHTLIDTANSQWLWVPVFCCLSVFFSLSFFFSFFYDFLFEKDLCTSRWCIHLMYFSSLHHTNFIFKLIFHFIFIRWKRWVHITDVLNHSSFSVLLTISIPPFFYPIFSMFLYHPLQYITNKIIVVVFYYYWEIQITNLLVTIITFEPNSFSYIKLIRNLAVDFVIY